MFSRQDKKDPISGKFFARSKTERVYDPIRSLFFNYQNIRDIGKTEIAKANQKSLYEGMLSPDGPKGTLDKNQIQKINILADIRLKTIAESGLTREEILGVKPKGLPILISKDPFFNLIRTNYQVRLNLIKDSEEYNVQKIVSLALRQDIGPDTSLVATGHRITDRRTPYNSRFSHMKDNIEKPSEQTDLYQTEDTPSPADYKQEELFEACKPLTKKPERIRKEIKIDLGEVHYRNTEFLSQFLTNFGRIKHHRVTGLSVRNHRIVARAIKHSRDLSLLPRGSYLKPHHRQSLKTLSDDIMNDLKYGIDLETGAIQKEEDDATFEFRTNHFNYSHGFLKAVNINELKEESHILVNAQRYALYLKEQYLKTNGVSMLDLNSNERKEGRLDLNHDIIKESEIDEYKKAYEIMRNEFSHIASENFIECLLNEKLDNIQGLHLIKKNILPKSDSSTDSNTYDELLGKIKTLKKNINPQKVDFPTGFFENNEMKKIISKLSKSN